LRGYNAGRKTAFTACKTIVAILGNTNWVGEGAREIQDIHSRQAIILCVPGLTQTQSLLKKGKKVGLIAERIMTMNSMEVVANLTANGCGIGILPNRVAQAIYPGRLKRIPKAPVYSDEVSLIYRNENRNVHAIQTIAKIIKDLDFDSNHNHSTCQK